MGSTFCYTILNRLEDNRFSMKVLTLALFQLRVTLKYNSSDFVIDLATSIKKTVNCLTC